MVFSKIQQLKSSTAWTIYIKLIPWLFGYIILFAFPLADMHTCELPNGDQIKYRKIYFYSIIGDISKVIFWHSNANNGPPFSDKSWYVTDGLFEPNFYLIEAGNCYDYKIYGELVELYRDGLFLISGGILKPANVSTQNSFPALSGNRWKLTPDEEKMERILPSNTSEEQNKRSEFFRNIDQQRRKEYFLDNTLFLDGPYFFGKFDNELWAEFGFTSKECASKYSICPITAIWQSHSIDDGKIWSKPIITKDAKLFVIGKSIKDQPGVAKDKGTLNYIGWF